MTRCTTTPETLADYTRRADPAPIPSHVERSQPRAAARNPAGPGRSRRPRPRVLANPELPDTVLAVIAPVPDRAAEARQISGDTSTPRRRGDLVLTLPTWRARFAADRLKAVDTGQLLLKDGSGVPRPRVISPHDRGRDMGWCPSSWCTGSVAGSALASARGALLWVSTAP